MNIKYLILIPILFLIGNSGHAQALAWNYKGEMGTNLNTPPSRQNATTFTIGSKAYLGLGQNGGNTDFWEYDPTTNLWTQKANFPGDARAYAIAFSIGNKGYVGGGDGYDDFYEFDPTANTWTQKDSFAALNRSGSVSFSIGNKGYFGTGNFTKDFYEYNPANDTWTQKANFGGQGRSNAAGFVIGNKGYIATGDTFYIVSQIFMFYDARRDIWEYDPSTDTWTKKTDFPVAVQYGVGYSANGKGYLGFGLDSVGSTYLTTIREFDPVANTWTAKTTYPGLARLYACSFAVNNGLYYGMGTVNAKIQREILKFDLAANTWTNITAEGATDRRLGVSFSIGTKGYLGLGSNGAMMKDFWEYDPISNTWSQKADFGGSARRSAACFSIGNKAYVAAGFDGSLKKDFWEYNSITNTWTQKTDYPGTAVSGAVGFSIGTKGYVFRLSNFYEYNPDNDTWTAKAYPSAFGATYTTLYGFSTGTKGYVGGGSSSASQSFYEYDPTTNVWTSKSTMTNFATLGNSVAVNGKGYYLSSGNNGYISLAEYTPSSNTWTYSSIGNAPTNRNNATAFSIGTKAYYGTGNNSSGNLNDIWELSTANNPTIQIGTIVPSVCAGAVISVPYSIYNSANPSNVFTAQLSNALGFFPTTPVAIGTISSNVSGVITATIPTNTPAGTGYRIRIVSSDPVITGTSNTSNITITVPVTPTIAINASSNAICPGVSVQFTSSIQNGGTTPTYQWKKNGTNITGATSSTYSSTNLNDGDLINCVLTSNIVCTTINPAPSNTINMMVNTLLPAISITSNVDTICAGSNVVFTAMASNAGANPTYQWKLNGININGATNANYSTPSLTAVDSISCELNSVAACPNFSTVQSNKKGITVLTLPFPVITNAGNASFCVGQSTSLQTGSNGIWSYAWSNNNNPINSANSPSLLVAQSGNYRVTIANSFGCNQTSVPYTITVYSLPIVHAGNDTAVCLGQSAMLQATSNDPLSWSNGLQNNQPFIPNTSNNYVVTATDIHGCMNYDTVAITVNSLPQIQAGYDQEVCFGDSVLLNASGGINYVWNNGVSNNQSFVPSNSSSYFVSGTDIHGCVGQDTLQIIVHALPLANAGIPKSICNGGSTTLTASGGDHYLWSNGDTTVATNINQAGNYYVIAFNSFGCKDTSNAVTVSIKTMPNPVKIKYSSPSVVCSPGTVALSFDLPLGAVSGFDYQWFQSGTIIAGATDSTYLATASGSYVVSVKGGSNCMKFSSPLTTTIKPQPTAQFSIVGNDTMCLGHAVTFTAPQILAYNYSWLKDGLSAGGGATKNFKVAGTYMLVAKQNGCFDTSAPVVIVVNALPVASITAATPATFCAGDSCTLLASPITAVNYEWHLGSGIATTTNNPVYNVGVSGSFKVMVTDSNGCMSKLSATVIKTKVNPLPIASISTTGSTTISATGSVKLKALPSAANSYVWYKDGLLINGASSQNFNAYSGGVYTVVVTKLGCSAAAAPFTITQTTPKYTNGITSNVRLNISAYPNPVNDVLTLTISSIAEVNGAIQVMDALGKVVMSFSCKDVTNQNPTNSQQGTSNYQLSTTHWPQGIYLIRYKDDFGNTGIVKVVKE